MTRPPPKTQDCPISRVRKGAGRGSHQPQIMTRKTPFILQRQELKDAYSRVDAWKPGPSRLQPRRAMKLLTPTSKRETCLHLLIHQKFFYISENKSFLTVKGPTPGRTCTNATTRLENHSKTNPITDAMTIEKRFL